MQIVLGRAAESLEHRLGLVAAVDAHQHLVANEVDSLQRIVVGVLGGDIENRECRSRRLDFTLHTALCGEPLLDRGQEVFRRGIAAGDVHRDGQGGFFLGPLDHREAQLSHGDALQVVPTEAEPIGHGAELVFKLLLETFPEGGHHFVVEHLAELRLLETLFRFFRAGDGDIALGRRRQQHVAGRSGDRDSGVWRDEGEKKQRGAAKLGKTQSNTP